MDSLYGKYIKERTGKSIIENEHGFAVYSFGEKFVYIEEIYVVESERKSGIATIMANKIAEIAKEQGISEMIGSVCPTANGSTTSLKVLLSYGMRLKSASQDFIVMSKDI